jgi:hypothetical protein
MPGVSEQRLRDEIARVQQGYLKDRDKLRAEGKLFVRDRLRRLASRPDRAAQPVRRPSAPRTPSAPDADSNRRCECSAARSGSENV